MRSFLLVLVVFCFAGCEAKAPIGEHAGDRHAVTECDRCKLEWSGCMRRAEDRFAVCQREVGPECIKKCKTDPTPSGCEKVCRGTSRCQDDFANEAAVCKVTYLTCAQPHSCLFKPN